MKKIAIIDYHMGNLFSVHQACLQVGTDPEITSDPEKIALADIAILPGVGAFGDAMQNLSSLGLITPIHAFIESGKPFMGVCLGLQLLFSESEELGNHKGLGIIEGTVKRFSNQDNTGNKIKVPQIEWNEVNSVDEKRWNQSPLHKCKTGEFMYFVHSYYVIPSSQEVILSTTNYGGLEYCSSILKDNIFACQFHPEKSGAKGLEIYRSFLL